MKHARKVEISQHFKKFVDENPKAKKAVLFLKSGFRVEIPGPVRVKGNEAEGWGIKLNNSEIALSGIASMEVFL